MIKYNTSIQNYVSKTDSNGHYTISDLCPGSYKIEPYYIHTNGYRWSFSPAYQIKTIADSNVEGVNFEVRTHMIDGWITIEGGRTYCNTYNPYVNLKIKLNGVYDGAVSDSNCFWQISGLPNGYYSIRAENLPENYYCYEPEGARFFTIDDFTQQDANKHNVNFMVYLGNIEGYVKEIWHNIDGSTETYYIEGANVQILENNSISTTQSNGKYQFIDQLSNHYSLKATKSITLEDGTTYTTTYNPNPRNISLCASDLYNQNFSINVYPLRPPRIIIGPPISIGFDFTNITVIAGSLNYWTQTTAREDGTVNLPLPEGSYKIYPIKECNVFYPPYISLNISENFESYANFSVAGWKGCEKCYPTFYDDQFKCSKLLEGQDECYFQALTKFRDCTYVMTKNENSELYNAIILSVQAYRSNGKPEEFIETFLVEEEGDYFINITNGDYFNKETAVSSAEISLSGFGQIFSPKDFNKDVFHLKKQFHLTPGEYQISTILRSQPGSYLTIVISTKDISSFIELP